MKRNWIGAAILVVLVGILIRIVISKYELISEISMDCDFLEIAESDPKYIERNVRAALK